MQKSADVDERKGVRQAHFSWRSLKYRAAGFHDDQGTEERVLGEPRLLSQKVKLSAWLLEVRDWRISLVWSFGWAPVSSLLSGTGRKK